eukprot:6471264-Amphidinium_carterae.1
MKRSGRPDGTKCWYCNQVWRRGWPNMCWESLVTSYGTDESVRKAVTLALSIVQKLASPEKPFPALKQEEFVEKDICGMKVKRSCYFLPEASFTKVLGVPSNAVKFPLTSAHDELGTPCKGLLLRAEGPLLPEMLEVELFATKTTDLATCILSGQHTLRSGQGRDIAALWRKDLQAAA